MSSSYSVAGHYRGVSGVLAFISVFGVSCRQGLCYCSGPGAEQFPVFPGRGFIKSRLPAIYRRLCGHKLACLRRLMMPDFHSNPYSDRRLL